MIRTVYNHIISNYTAEIMLNVGIKKQRLHNKHFLFID